MDFEQIQKKLDWLDAERRKDKDVIAGLEIQVTAYQTEVGKLTKRLGQLEGELARAFPAKDQFGVLEEKINGVQIELSRALEQSIAQISSGKEDEETRLSERFLAVQQEVADLQSELENIPVLEEQLEARKDEEFKLRRLIAEVDEKIDKRQHDDESWLRTITLLEEGRRKDSTRIVELQSEYDNVRKRVEEQVGKVEVVAENVRKMDGRIAELRQAETQRGQEQRTIAEKQSLKTLELERDWKKVQTTFESFMEKFTAYERKMAEVSMISQSLTDSQDTFDDNNDRIEKRIHEITEMQRLNREQFHAEWETFLGEEKHRWAQYMIEEEERRKDQERKASLVTEQVTELTQSTQTLSDTVVVLKKEIQNYWRQMVDVTKTFIPKND